MEQNLEQQLIASPDAPSGYTTPCDNEIVGESIEDVLSTIGRMIADFHAMELPTERIQAPCLSLFGKRETIADQAYEHADGKVVPLHGRLSPSDVVLSGSHIHLLPGANGAVGDPAVDLAHMMAHLNLLAVARESATLLTAVGSFHSGYARALPEKDIGLMRRAGPLTARFMQSIAESAAYLSSQQKDEVGVFCNWWLGRSDYTVGDIRWALWTAIDMGFANSLIDWRQEAIRDRGLAD